MIFASFHTYDFDSSEVTAIAGSIRYPYQKIDRIRNYTTLQIASKPRETITISATFEDATRFTALNNLALSRIKGDFYLGSKYWGKFVISRIDRQIDSIGRIIARIEFTQIAATTAIGDFTPISGASAHIGLFDIAKEELLGSISESLTFPTDELTRLQNFPVIQDGEDDLTSITLRLRFSSNYNANPQKRLDTIRALADNYTPNSLTINGTNYGDYVVEALRWQATLLDTFDLSIELLQSPTGFPLKKPIISSFVVNSVQKANTLAPHVVSLSYTENVTGGTSILEITLSANASDIPVEGDSIEVKFKYEGDSNEFNTGTHKCDYPERSYAPDTVTIGAQSYDYNLSLNAKDKVVYTNIKLSAIVADIARRFNLSVVGNISNIVAGTAESPANLRTVVSTEGYVALLRALARDYGYAFELKLGNLYFQDFTDLESSAVVGLLTPTDCISARFTQKVKGTYMRAHTYYNTGLYATVTDGNVTTADYLGLEKEGYYASSDSALRRGRGALKEANRFKHTGELELEGKSSLEAGKNLQLGSFDDASDNGKFQIEKITHTISDRGWLCQLGIRKIL